MLNNRSKILSITHFIFALSLLFFSLYSLSNALTYDRRQSFAPPTLKWDAPQNQYLVMNMKTPLLLLFTFLFGLGWWCESFSESLLLKNNRNSAFVVFYIPVTIQIIFFIAMTQYPIGFINSALVALGWIVISGFYLRYTMISPKALEKLSPSK